MTLQRLDAVPHKSSRLGIDSGRWSLIKQKAKLLASIHINSAREISHSSRKMMYGSAIMAMAVLSFRFVPPE
jgi:hypothetical protein